MLKVELINKIREEHPELFDEDFENKIYEEVYEAIKAEENIVDWILQDYKNDFLSKEILLEFIKNRLNESLEQIGFKKQFIINKDLLDKTLFFNEEIYAPTLTDFFHKKPIDYQKKAQKYSEETIF